MADQRAKAIETTKKTDKTEKKLRRIGFSDEVLVRNLLSGHPGAPAELFDQYGDLVQHVLVSTIGVDDELPELLHEVFARALADIKKLDDPSRLKAWLTSIAVFTARGCIRRRKRGKWLRFWEPDELCEIPDGKVSFEARETLASLYDVLEQLPTDERIVFSLRYVNGMELTEVAAACKVSLSTIKRRLGKANRKFVLMARRDPVLASYVKTSKRWGAGS